MATTTLNNTFRKIHSASIEISANPAGTNGAYLLLKLLHDSIRIISSTIVNSDEGMNTNTAASTPPKAETEIISPAYTDEIIHFKNRRGRHSRRSRVQYAIRKKAYIYTSS